MKITYSNDKYIIILKNIFNEDKNELCEHIINLLNDKFNLDINGFVEVDIYIDERYGTILELTNNYDDIYSSFKRTDFNINVINSKFIYKINDIFSFNINKFYIYEDEYYILLEDVDNKSIEFCQLIYKNCDYILKNSKLVVL